MAPENKKLAETLTKLTDAANQPEGARNALAMLFPRADAVLETYVPNDEADGWGRTKEQRISEAAFAPTYFRLDPTPISWSRSELEAIMKLGPKRGLAAVEERVQKFSDNDNAHLRRLFLEFLTASLSEPGIFSAEWFHQLMAASPSYIIHRQRKAGDFFEDEGFLPFNRLLLQAFKRLSVEQRYLIAVDKLDQLKEISVFCDFFRSTVGDINPKGVADGRQRLFFGERTEELRERLVDKVRNLAQSGEIWAQASPARLIWFWWGSNHGEEVKEFLSSSMRSPKTLREVINLVIGTVISSAGNYERISRSYEKIVDLDELTSAAQKLLKLNLDSGDAKLVERYLQALKAGERSSAF